MLQLFAPIVLATMVSAAPQGAEETPPPPPPFLVVGVLQTRITHPPGFKGGLVVRCWRPPSEADWRQLILAHGVPVEHVPAFSDILSESAAKFQSLDQASVPQIIAANAPVASDPNPDPATRADAMYEIQRRLVPYLSELEREEERTTRAIATRAAELGFTASDVQREVIQQAFKDARTRAKCAQLNPSMEPARADLGLAAIESLTTPLEAHENSGLKSLIREYWAAATPPAAEHVRWHLTRSIRYADLNRAHSHAGPGPERDAAFHRFEEAMRERTVALSRLTALNMQWLPRLREKMPPADREAFDRVVDTAMFPRKGFIVDEAPRYMRRALLLPSLDAGQRATLSELLDRSERKCAEFEASLRQAWVDSGLIMHGAPPKPGLTLKEQNDVIAGIVAARKKANREWYLVAEGVLSLEQREALKRQTQPDARPESTSLR